MQLPLTKKQKQILDYIVQYIRENEYPPSYEEIGQEFNINSPATIHQHIKALQDKRYLKKKYNEKRSLEPVWEVLNFKKAIELPLVGIITAGLPIEAVEDNETMVVPANLAVDGLNSYVLRVKGESMIEDGILDGDYVIVERNPSPRNGEVVVALLDNTYATLKRFYREAHRIRLQPANSKMNPIFVKDVIIQGVVKAVIRQFNPVY